MDSKAVRGKPVSIWPEIDHGPTMGRIVRRRAVDAVCVAGVLVGAGLLARGLIHDGMIAGTSALHRQGASVAPARHPAIAPVRIVPMPVAQPVRVPVVAIQAHPPLHHRHHALALRAPVPTAVGSTTDLIAPGASVIAPHTAPMPGAQTPVGQPSAPQQVTAPVVAIEPLHFGVRHAAPPVVHVPDADELAREMARPATAWDYDEAGPAQTTTRAASATPAPVPAARSANDVDPVDADPRRRDLARVLPRPSF